MQLTHQDLVNAINTRHSVRVFDDAHVVEPGKLDVIRQAIDDINRQHPELAFRLVTDEPLAFGGRWASYGNFRGVTNYIVVAGDREKSTDVLCGRAGEDIVLLLQHMGLNSCWVGLTYKKIDGAFSIPKDARIRCLIALGYGVDPAGRGHKIKSPQQVSNIGPDTPEWFASGVDMALKAPTAVNQQKFYFEYLGENRVKAIARFSMVGYSRIDLGIAITHFVIGADNGNLVIEPQI